MDNDFIIAMQLGAGICGALSTAVVAVCTVLNNRYAAQHVAGSVTNAALTTRVSNEISALSDKVDTQIATQPPDGDKK